MTKESKKIIFIPASDIFLNIYIKLFKLIQKKYQKSVIFILTYKSDYILPKCANVINISTNKEYEKAIKLSFLKKLFVKSLFIQRLYFFIKNKTLFGYYVYKQKLNFQKKYKIIEDLLNDFEIKRIIVSSDRMLINGYGPCIINYSRKNKTELVFLQAAAIAFEPSIINIRRSKYYEYTYDFAPHLKAKYPKQYKNFKGQSYGYYKPEVLIALSELNMLVENPWIEGSSKLMKMIIHNNIQKRLLTKNGIDEKSIRVTGRIEHDHLKKNISENKKIKSEDYQKILIALPQVAEHGMVDMEDSLKLNKTFIKALLKLDNLNITISLHPKMNLDFYKYHFRGLDIKLIQSNIELEIAIQHLFLSFFSSTIDLAILSNVAAANIDFWSLGKDYKFMKSIYKTPVFDDIDSICDFIKKELKTNFPFSKLREEQSEIKKDLSPFDGRAINEIMRYTLS